MIERPTSTSLSRRRIDRRLEVAGCRVALAIDAATGPSSASAAAARLAEDLVAARIGCERRLIRVAALMPSGRPVALLRGRQATVRVSVSHSGCMIGAAVCAAAGVGLDIVDPTEAGHGLDAWFTPDERALLPDEDGLLRARLWAAKEAAFKASGLDDGFRPRAVDIDHLSHAGFRWCVRGNHERVDGLGMFTFAGIQLVALAVAVTRPGMRLEPPRRPTTTRIA